VETWPVSIEEVSAARERIRPYLAPTAVRHYAALDEAVGRGIRVSVKHENHNPTNAFKVRNAFSAMTALPSAARARGVVAATRGNHGAGLAYAGQVLGVPVTVCVPRGNSPAKNAMMRGYGASLVEEGRDYDEAAAVAARLVETEGLTLVHSTNNRDVIAGASTLHDAFHTGSAVARDSADTFADGLATRGVYEMTFPALRAGLAGFVTATDAELAEAMRMLLSTTHNLVEGAGAAGLAGLFALRDRLVGARVGIVISGGNVDMDVLTRILRREI
jgi:threonine dehydratase